MATITKTIGSDGGDDYATVQLWDDAALAATEIETNANIWEGNMRNEAHDPNAIQTLDGHTTSATAYKHLTALGGTGFESFIEQFGTGTGLSFNANGGARFDQTTLNDDTLVVNDLWCRFSRLQIRGTGNYAQAIQTTGNGSLSGLDLPPNSRPISGCPYTSAVQPAGNCPPSSNVR